MTAASAKPRTVDAILKGVETSIVAWDMRRRRERRWGASPVYTDDLTKRAYKVARDFYYLRRYLRNTNGVSEILARLEGGHGVGDCPRCGGTGQYAHFGPCFRCGGTGSLL